MKILFSGDYDQSIDIQNPLWSPELEGFVSDCDYRCCNYEGPCKTSDTKTLTKIGPSISQEISSVERLANAGFNIVSLANNHIMDYGTGALRNTLKIMRDNQVLFAGAGLSSAEAYKPLILHKDTLTVGILCFAENGFGALTQRDGAGYAWFGDERSKTLIDECVGRCDKTIIVCHGGAEKWDYPLPEYRALYRSWIDRGVDAVIAHHPHVPQGWEKYNSGLIFYSLGNFSFNKGTGYQDPETIVCKLNITEEGIDFETMNIVCMDGTINQNTSKDFEDHIDKCNMILRSD